MRRLACVRAAASGIRTGDLTTRVANDSCDRRPKHRLRLLITPSGTAGRSVTTCHQAQMLCRKHPCPMRSECCAGRLQVYGGQAVSAARANSTAFVVGCSHRSGLDPARRNKPSRRSVSLTSDAAAAADCAVTGEPSPRIHPSASVAHTGRTVLTGSTGAGRCQRSVCRHGDRSGAACSPASVSSNHVVQPQTSQVS